MITDTFHPGPTLVADIGGTHARFALARGGAVSGDVMVLACQDHADLASAVKVFLQALSIADRPQRGVIAVAAPVSKDVVRLTNLNWTFSRDQLRQDLGLDVLDIINDFTAIAWAVSHLQADEYGHVGGGKICQDSPKVIIGPGSGLGVAALIPSQRGWVVLPTEGGHVTLAAVTDQEERVLNVLRRKFGHVSAERVVSGPGLVHVFSALLELDGQTSEPLSPQQVSALALADSTSTAALALEMFFEFLGTTAANAALSLDARGGVYLDGGILTKLEGAFLASGFRRRFEDKGRFSGYLSEIPTLILQHPFPALKGLAVGLNPCV